MTLEGIILCPEGIFKTKYARVIIITANRSFGILISPPLYLESAKNFTTISSSDAVILSPNPGGIIGACPGTT